MSDREFCDRIKQVDGGTANEMIWQRAEPLFEQYLNGMPDHHPDAMAYRQSNQWEWIGDFNVKRVDQGTVILRLSSIDPPKNLYLRLNLN